MNADLFETSKALSDLSRIFDALKIPYFLVGSFASGVHGEFRATNDIDVVCQISGQTLDRFIESLSPAFVCDEVAFREYWRAQRSYNIIHEETFIKVDLFFNISPLEAEEFGRVTSVPVPGTENPVAVSSVEYNIIAKLRWFRQSNDQLARQLEDVQSMIRLSSSSISKAYIHKWANELNLTDLVQKFLP